MTNLYIIGYRNPFLAAKAIASLDSLSGGRVILGTGAGYLERSSGRSAVTSPHGTSGSTSRSR
jgi:alkanesulfonate monooxygenase SsuD/methylene tetrahydromethanopterin reductase-like flavin-dependent oxidoreductase (luciferase family)